MPKRTQRSDDGGSSRRRRGADDTSPPPSTRSDSRSSGSKPHYRRPGTALEFASQANDVCTRLLNGEIDIRKAKAYAALARVVSQTISAEVTRARFLKEAPDLRLLPQDGDDDTGP
jgi:hypothetical protein